MPRPLALHQITAMEASPEELVSIAAAVGCDRVCIFVYSPAAGISFPVVTRATKAAFLGRLRGEGVGVANLEYFPITAETDLDAYRAPLELGAELGACLAVTHVHDAEEDRAADTLGRFADLAAECGLAIGLEFMGLSPGCNSLARAVRLIDRIDRPNAGIAVDALHLVRTGGTPAEVAALAPAYFAYSQICDGHGLAPSSDYLPEALDRVMPGEGDFPLLALIEALPEATALDVEVPSVRLAADGVPALERARRAVVAARRLIESARLTR